MTLKEKIFLIAVVLVVVLTVALIRPTRSRASD